MNFILYTSRIVLFLFFSLFLWIWKLILCLLPSDTYPHVLFDTEKVWALSGVETQDVGGVSGRRLMLSLETGSWPRPWSWDRLFLPANAQQRPAHSGWALAKRQSRISPTFFRLCKGNKDRKRWVYPWLTPVTPSLESWYFLVRQRMRRIYYQKTRLAKKKKRKKKPKTRNRGLCAFLFVFFFAWFFIYSSPALQEIHDSYQSSGRPRP